MAKITAIRVEVVLEGTAEERREKHLEAIRYAAACLAKRLPQGGDSDRNGHRVCQGEHSGTG